MSHQTQVRSAAFRFALAAPGLYTVTSAEGMILGTVAKGRRGWSSRPVGDPKPTPADRPTRAAAAERLALIRETRAAAAAADRPAPTPAGFELIDATGVEPGDAVVTADRLTASGAVKRWSRYGPRTVAEVVMSAHGAGAVLCWVHDGGVGREWPGMAVGPGWRTVARRVATEKGA